MIDFYIVVEGDDDENFIKQLLNNEFPALTVEFIQTETNASSLLTSNVAVELVNTVVSAEENYSKTLFILDTDTRSSQETKEAVIQAFSDFTKIKANNIFAMPNGRGSGCLEHLLIELIPENYAEFHECVASYARCVNNLPLNLDVNEKERCYIYTASLTRNNQESSGSKRNYNNEFWDLESEALTPLLNFLKQHLKNES